MTPDYPDGATRRPGFVELITVIATMMALTALSIDIMLPALPDISDSFGLADPNQRQLMITWYLLGFAAGQIVYGPLSDSHGRKPVLVVGLTVYALASAGTFLAGDYTLLLVARVFQGIGAAAPRVLAIAVVRDLFGGRQMARVMSFVMMVFIIIPVIAPSIGELILLFAAWEWIFLFLLVVSLVLLAVSLARLPETRPRALRAPLSARWLGRAVVQVVTTRQTLGYTVAIGFVFGCLSGYITSAQQIFEEVYELGSRFVFVFGAIAATMAVASLTNGSLVQRFGMRRLSHGALVGFAVVAGLHVVVALVALPGHPPLLVFAGLIALDLFLFGFIMPNFNAIAMEPLYAIAGTGSSFIGFFTTGVGAVLGWYVGQQYDGTVLPLTLGYFGLSLCALVAVVVTEGGRLFQPQHES